MAAVTSQAPVTSVTVTPGNSGVCDDAGPHPGKATAFPYVPVQQQASGATIRDQERALRYFSMTQSSKAGHPEPELNSSPLLTESQGKAGAPPPATSSAGEQQGEALDGGGRECREEEVRGRHRGGATEESEGGGVQGKPPSPDRDRDDKRRRQQHPQPQHSARPSVAKGESQSPDSWTATGGGGAQGETAHGSSKQEQERSSGQSKAGVSGKAASPMPYAGKGRGRMRELRLTEECEWGRAKGRM